MKIHTPFIFAALLSSKHVTAQATPSRQASTANNNNNNNDNLNDFDEFNQLFQNVKFRMPDAFEVSEQVGSNRLDMTIKNMVCNNLAIGDIQIHHEHQENSNGDGRSSTVINVFVNILQLELDCEMQYSYTYGLGNTAGEGRVKLATAGTSSVNSTLAFTSDDFSSMPPHEPASMKTCVADIEVQQNSLEFDGDVVAVDNDSTVAAIVSPNAHFQGIVRGVVEREVGAVACSELGSLGTTLVTSMIAIAEEKLDPFQGVLPNRLTDPLYLEETIQLPEDLHPLNLHGSETSMVGKLFKQSLDSLNRYLGTTITSSTEDSSGGGGSASNSNARDLIINKFIRDNFLDADRAFAIPSDQFMKDNVIFEGHDRLTETRIILNDIRVFGLDTLARVNPFIDFGKRTIRTWLTWDMLKITFDMTLKIKPSSLEDSLSEGITSVEIAENFTAHIQVDSFDALASLLLVIDEESLGSLELGSLFQTENLFPCLLSTVHTVQMSGVEVYPHHVGKPIVNGFFSPGIERVVTGAVDAAFAMYSGTLRRRLPNIFQTRFRDFIDFNLIDPYLSNTEQTSCPNLEAPHEGVVDFRELLDPTGESKYGNVLPMLKRLFDEELLQPREGSHTSSPKVNEVLIGTYTEKQSGVEGELHFSGHIFEMGVSDAADPFGVDLLQLQLSNPRIKNVDTLRNPIELLIPAAAKGHVLNNELVVGSRNEPLVLSFDLSFALYGDTALETYNDIELRISLVDTGIMASIMANMDATMLATFPLREVDNFDCWLATLIGDGENADTNVKNAFSLAYVLVSAASVDFGASCLNCTGLDLAFVPEILGGLHVEGVSNVLGERLLILASDLLMSDYMQAYLDRLVAGGSLRCPHSQNFEGGVMARPQHPGHEFPTLSLDALETLVLGASVVLQIAAVVIANDHADYDPSSTDALSGQYGLELEPSISLVDFTSLKSSIGKRASNVVDELIMSLTGMENNDLRINNVLRSELLDGDGAIKKDFDYLTFEGDGNIPVSFQSVRVNGVDTIDSIRMLDAIGPQTVRNEVSWEKLGVEFVVSMAGTERGADSRSAVDTVENITFSLELAEVRLSFALLLAIDLDLLDFSQLASISDMNHVLPCILSAARSINLTELDVSVGSMLNMTVTGFHSRELSEASSVASRFIVENYGGLLLRGIPGFFDSVVRTLLNNWIAHYSDGLTDTTCRDRYPMEKGDNFASYLILSFGIAVVAVVSVIVVYGMVRNRLIVQSLPQLEDEKSGLTCTTTNPIEYSGDDTQMTPYKQ